MSRANARNNYHTKWIVCILEIAINEITMVNKDIFISFFHLFIFFFSYFILLTTRGRYNNKQVVLLFFGCNWFGEKLRG